MKSLYTIIFKNGSDFLGGNIIETKWIDIPNNPIKRIIYNLPTGDNLVLSGYDKYFQMIEVAEDVYGKTKGRKEIEFTYIMGKKDGIIVCYKIRIKTGDIEKKIYKETDKFLVGLNKTGWK